MYYRDIQVIRLESKVVSNFSQYESVCKHAKEEVKSTLMARERQLARKKMLERIQEKNPRDRQQIVSLFKYFHKIRCYFNSFI